MPYSLVGKMQGKLVARNFQVVVCGELFFLMCLRAIRLTCSLVYYTDESHFIKDAKAQRTKAVVPSAQSGAARDLPHRHTRAEPAGGALLASRGAPTERVPQV